MPPPIIHAGTHDVTKMEISSAAAAAMNKKGVCAVASQFLKELRNKVKPLDMQYPRDIKKANNGARMKNINRASKICTQMITVKRC